MLFWHVPAPNEALLISGSRRKGDETQFRIVTGHGTLVIPIKQKARILSHGSWPPKPRRDASNRVSGKPEAIAFGERLCHFYRTEDELLGLLVPYFRQGLEHGERCLWLAGTRPSEKARQSIASLADRQHPPEQLEVVEMDDWTPDVDAWSREQERALAQGYSGLRICGEALDLEGETEIARTKALSTYSAQSTSTSEIGSVILRHDAALVKNIDVWQRVPTADPHAAATILSALID